jgi:hypothetical protein
MEVEGFEVIQLELKYCERCGGLWLRLHDVQDVYCALCVVEMLDLPAPRRSASRTRLPVTGGVQTGQETASAPVFCGKAGTA